VRQSGPQMKPAFQLLRLRVLAKATLRGEQNPEGEGLVHEAPKTSRLQLASILVQLLLSRG